MATDTARPQTSDRDHDDLRRRLTAWLGRQLPDGANPELTSFEVPSGTGMSSETILLDVAATIDGSRENTPCVARLAPESSAVPVFPSYDMDKQFRVMRLVAEATDLPIPRPLWYEPDAAVAGTPFFVMERVDGIVPPDLMPYGFGSWLSQASPEDQRRLQDASVGVLAAIHGIDRAKADYGFLELDRPEPTALRRHVADQWAYYHWVSDGRPQPLLERGYAWLQEHWPADEGEDVLSWGDSRIGNIMYRDFAPVAVLDWEMASVAPREVDLAWFIFLHRFFEDLGRSFGVEGMPHFLRREDVVATYESLTGYAPRDLDFYLMYAGWRHGIIMTRVNQRSIHFGEMELPDDPDDLVNHRRTLEAMMDGTYWESV